MASTSQVKEGYARKFGVTYQAHGLAVILRVPGVAVSYRSVLSDQYFTADVLRTIAKPLLKHVDDYRTAPSRATLLQMIENEVPEKVFPAIKKQVSKLYKADVSDHKSVVESLVHFGRTQAVAKATLEAAELINRGELDAILPIMNKAVQVGNDLESKSIEYTQVTLDERRAWYDESVDAVPLGWSIIDNCLNGGTRRGEMWGFAAGAKKGKSLGLVNVHYGTAMAGFNSLYLSCELSGRYVARRMDARVAGKKIGLLQTDRERYIRYVQSEAERSIPGKLDVMSFPTRTLTASRIRKILDRMVDEGRPIDRLVVDYPNIMRAESRREEKKHDQVAGIWEDLRGICGEYNLSGIGALQVKQSAFKKDVIDLDDFAEAWEIAMVIDGALGLCITPEEEAEQQGRIVVIGARNSGSGQVVRCKIMRDRALIRDVELLDPTVALQQRQDADRESKRDRERRPQKKVTLKKVA